MATATAKKEEDKTALVASAAAALPADLMDDIMADAGAGTSQSADDNIVPFVVLLQDMSPEVKKRDPEYVEGAEPGMLLNKATRQLYSADADQAEATGKPMLVFQPCAFDRAIIEWVPRNAGGGFVARHELKGTVEQTMASLGAKQVEITDEQGEKKLIWRSASGKNDMIDTRYHFGNILNPDGSISAAVIGFASTGHTASREWMTLMNNFKVKVGDKLVVAPSWSKQYIVHSKPKKNTKGDFFVITVDDGGIIADKSLRAEGKLLHEAFSKGAVRADDAQSAEGSSGASSQGEQDVPI